MNAKARNSVGKIDAHDSERSFPLVMLLLNLISFAALFAVFLKNDYLYFGLDGNYMRTIAIDQFSRLPLEMGLTNNFLQGLGNIWFPMNAKTIPGYIAFHQFSDQPVAETASYVVFSIELFLATVLAGRICRLSWSTCLLGAWALPFLAMPVFGPPKLYAILPLAPTITTLIATATLSIAMFSVSGTRSFSHTVYSGAIFTLSVLYILIANPAAIVLAAPAIALFCIVYLAAVKKRIEMLTKLAVLALFSLVMLAGPTQYVLGLLRYTAANVYSKDFFNDRASTHYISILFHGGAGTVMAFLALLGAIMLMFNRRGDDRTPIVAVLIFAGLLQFAGVISLYWGNWKGPSPLYLEFLLWPFYAVMAAEALRMLGRIALKPRLFSIPDAASRFLERRKLILIAVLAWPLALVVPVAKSHMDGSGRHDQTASSRVVETLKKALSLSPVSEFRGRVATFTGRMSLDKKFSWFDLHSGDYRLIKSIGNDYRMVGLWDKQIPTLMEYSPLISPAFHAFATRFFLLPGDTQVRNTLTMRNPQAKYLSALGVRFVLTDAPIEGWFLKDSMPAPGYGTLFLYELKQVNVGNYSPVRTILATSLEESFSAISASGFEFERNALINEPLGDSPNLVKASGADLRIERDVLHVKADSTGWSLLVLPLEFSHCLSLENASGARLLRVNVLETGVLFEHRVDAYVRFSIGPFRNSDCRLKDLEEFTRLSIRP